MMRLATYIALGLANSVFANSPIGNSVFVNDPLTAVIAAAPLWHFDVKTCFPSSATLANGSQAPSVPQDLCETNGKLNAGCPVQAPMTQSNQLATSFPTYYIVRQCSNDSSWRILYDVFFQKDTGHSYDWEWAIAKWLPNSEGLYVRDGMWLEQDGNRPYVKWSDITSTFNCVTDMHQDNKKDRDHPKAYFGKWKHSVRLDYNDEFANDCVGALINRKDYHSNDYQFFAADELVNGTTVPASYNYGTADSKPSAFLAGGKYDLCGSKFT